MNVLIHRPCSWGLMQPSTATWLAIMTAGLERMGYRTAHFETNTSRIAIARNNAAQTAISEKCDYLLMVDPDMQPDLYVGKHPQAEEFVDSSMQQLKDQPCSIVGAPATMPWPSLESNVRAFTDSGRGRRQITKQEVVERLANPYFEHVPCIGTGLMLIDVDVFRKLPQPWFRDVIDAEWQTLVLTQDFHFCLHAASSGIKTYCNWYSFAGHWHFERLGAPEPQKECTRGRADGLARC